MSDETEDGPEVREIYEKSTGYAIGHFPAHNARLCPSLWLAPSGPLEAPMQSRSFLQLASSKLLEAPARSHPFLPLAPSKLLEAPMWSCSFLQFASRELLEASARPSLSLCSPLFGTPGLATPYCHPLLPSRFTEPAKAPTPAMQTSRISQIETWDLTTQHPHLPASVMTLPASSYPTEAREARLSPPPGSRRLGKSSYSGCWLAEAPAP